ncbi:MAG: gliding motility protein GldN [Saprospiraceae bacterium]|nr:gliding motility protein GldN [Saprospiraceae bacterium]
MNATGKLMGLATLLVFFACTLVAQVPRNIMTESGEPLLQAPLDDIVEPVSTISKRIIPYETLREADIFWKKRVWRVIDIREKMNLPFGYPERPFISILIDAAKADENPMRVFSDEKFQIQLDTNQLNNVLFDQDTIEITDPETYETRLEVIRNDINPEDIKRYRIKEIWFFDKESSTMQVRILGVAPVVPVRADNGDLIGERSMFWVYYPEARQYLGRERVFNTFNDASPMTWEDQLEMRYFSSYIYKQSNVKDLRLQDEYTGRELLMQAERIKSEIFNFEHDLWSY